MEFQKEKQDLLKQGNRALKRAIRSKLKCQDDLTRCLAWEKMHQEGVLLQSNLYRIKRGMKHVSIPDWEREGQEKILSLDPIAEPYEQVALLFRKSRKLRLGIPHMQRQLLKMDAYIAQLENGLKMVEKAESEEELQIAGCAIGFKKAPPKKKKSAPEIQKRYREYISESGMRIWVGKNAKDNDFLTFQLANGSDYWFHVSDFPGSHVLLRVSDKNSIPDEESIKDALQVALHHSKARDRGEAEVSVTQRKYISKFGKAKAGQVQVSKHKSYIVRFDEKRFQELKERTRK